MARQVHERQNSATPSEAASYVEECDRLEQERERLLDELDAAFKKKKRELNKRINDEVASQLEDAKKVGVKKAIIRAIVNGQKGKRKAQELLASKIERADELLDALEADDRQQATSILDALGEDFAGLPLGAAAVAREEKPADDVTQGIVAAATAAWGGDEPKKDKAKH
ncbi:hypothetical protein [Mesorhizobium sp. ANAO-SY3R2]|uniref:hypothetical protein n=1 Tax=Mesorhizobium sp. ANAO-SY3R2 TaxID=3166644 RepID=UPI00366B5065